MISSKSNVIRYNRIGKQDWLSSSKIQIEKTIIFILSISLIFFVIPFFKSKFDSVKNLIFNFMSVKSALNNAINSLNESESLYNDGSKIIIKFFYQKNMINSINMDISTLKSSLKNKINNKDFNELSKHLDDFQTKSYSQVDDFKDIKSAVNSLIKVLKRIDLYV